MTKETGLEGMGYSLPAPFDVIGHLSHLFLAQTIDQVWEMHKEAMRHFGFDRLIYASTRLAFGQDFDSWDDALVLTSHDPEYVEAFFGKGLYAHAPMVRWTMENTGAISWGKVPELIAAGMAPPRAYEVLELNQKYGVIAGYSISFREISSRARGGIGLCARPGLSQADVDAIWAEYGDAILVLNNAMHLKLVHLPHQGAEISLTQRQREVLQWIADGKSVQNVATLLGVSPATVEKHLRLARENLKVETTAQAVLKAGMLNQIFVDLERTIVGDDSALRRNRKA